MAFDLKNARVAVSNARAVVPIGSRWRHIKRGSEYWVRAISIREEDGAPLIVYEDASTGTCWVRPFVEFIDGRFGRIADDSDEKRADAPEVRI